MFVSNKFDEIRPYTDEEVPEIMQRLLIDPVFNRVLNNFFGDETKVSGLGVFTMTEQ